VNPNGIPAQSSAVATQELRWVTVHQAVFPNRNAVAAIDAWYIRLAKLQNFFSSLSHWTCSSYTMSDFLLNSHNGFLVARLPEWNFDEAGRGAYSKCAPKLGNVYYGGVLRMPWFDLDEAFFSGRLPEELIAVRKNLKSNNPAFSGIDLCYDSEVTRTVLNYCNRQSSRNEIIAVRSPLLKEVKETAIESNNVIWQGFDIVALGHWSLLGSGLFWAPSYFQKWIEKLNSKGLFEDPSLVAEFVTDYETAASKGAVEPLPLPQIYGIDAIEIGRISP
jgi:hypothetical protein